MRILFLLLPIIPILIAACIPSENSSDPESEYSDLVKVNPPEGVQQQEESQVYIDNVEKVEYDGKEVLLIKGSFPDGCTHIKSAGHFTEGKTINISIIAWRDPDMMCSQVLTSFSFLYTNISEQVLQNDPALIVNKKEYQVQ